MDKLKFIALWSSEETLIPSHVSSCYDEAYERTIPKKPETNELAKDAVSHFISNVHKVLYQNIWGLCVSQDAFNISLKGWQPSLGLKTSNIFCCFPQGQVLVWDLVLLELLCCMSREEGFGREMKAGGNNRRERLQIPMKSCYSQTWFSVKSGPCKLWEVKKIPWVLPEYRRKWSKPPEIQRKGPVAAEKELGFFLSSLEYKLWRIWTNKQRAQWDYLWGAAIKPTQITYDREGEMNFPRVLLTCKINNAPLRPLGGISGPGFTTLFHFIGM